MFRTVSVILTQKIKPTLQTALFEHFIFFKKQKKKNIFYQQRYTLCYTYNTNFILHKFLILCV